MMTEDPVSGQVNKGAKRWFSDKRCLLVLSTIAGIGLGRGLLLWVTGMERSFPHSGLLGFVDMLFFGISHFMGFLFNAMFRGCGSLTLRLAATVISYPLSAGAIALPGIYPASSARPKVRVLLPLIYCMAVLMLNVVVGELLLPGVAPSM